MIPADLHQRVFVYDEPFVTAKQMVQEVTANAATLSSELTASGHSIVPGIYLDTGKTGVKPESDAALKEVAKVPQQNPALKLYVVGHTDNVGTLTSNMALSNQRAASVCLPPPGLVVRGLPVHVIDDEHRDRALLHLQFQPELFGHGVEEREGVARVRGLRC